MHTLAAIAPEFIALVARVLSEKGRADLVPQLHSIAVEKFIYDDPSRGGYLCVSPARPIPNLAIPVEPIGHTVFALGEHGFSVDLSRTGQILGLEIVAHEDVIGRLRQSNAL